MKAFHYGEKFLISDDIDKIKVTRMVVAYRSKPYFVPRKTVFDFFGVRLKKKLYFEKEIELFAPMIVHEFMDNCTVYFDSDESFFELNDFDSRMIQKKELIGKRKKMAKYRIRFAIENIRVLEWE